MFLSIEQIPPVERRKTKAFLDGVDISTDCFAADDVAGYVLLFVRNEHGKRYLVTTSEGGREAAWERRHGRVEISAPGYQTTGAIVDGSTQ